MNIAVIPARGGSSRIPKKNIKDFAGKPIIAYSIEAAVDSGLFDEVIVSTDSDEIAQISRNFGASVPFMRPAELSDNSVNVADVIKHAIAWFENQGRQVSNSCCIVATAPFIKSKYIVDGFNLMQEHCVDTVMSVAKYPHPVFRAFRKDDAGRIELLWPEYEFTHSNKLCEAYHDAAHFYWLNVKKFMQSGSIFAKQIMPIILPEYLVVDIDTSEDWDRAEIMYEVCKKRGLL
ncbi:MAG: pseudaminic acid cytidylyltransferase [Anaerohalosphaeraceae bacterium]|nr:pseudaminic acid cytidylyltransferase [Anaerohalosphaeraceae bacterium]